MIYFKSFIQKIYQYLISKFSTVPKKIIATDEETDNDNKVCIQFCLNDQDKVDILCDLPYSQSLNDKEMIVLSEKIAELLLGISYGLFRNEIIETLKNESKNTEDYQKILLIDNIISFYEMLKQEKLQSSAFFTQPIVAPSMVFADKT